VLDPDKKKETWCALNPFFRLYKQQNTPLFSKNVHRTLIHIQTRWNISSNFILIRYILTKTP